MNNACLLSSDAYRKMCDGLGSPFQVRNCRRLFSDVLMGAQEVYVVASTTLSSLPMAKTRLMASTRNDQMFAARAVAMHEV